MIWQVDTAVLNSHDLDRMLADGWEPTNVYLDFRTRTTYVGLRKQVPTEEEIGFARAQADELDRRAAARGKR